MNEAVFLAFADVHKSGIDPGQHVFNRAEIDIADLVAALGHHQFINTFVVENCSDSQLLGNDDLLGHGERDRARRAQPGEKSMDRIWLDQIWGRRNRREALPIPGHAMRWGCRQPVKSIGLEKGLEQPDYRG